MTPLQHPKVLNIRGPAEGFTVSVAGAPVCSDLDGSVVSMPHTPHVWAPGDPDGGARVIVPGRDQGLVFYYVDHAPGATLQIHVVVTSTDGTVLVDRELTSLPAYVDALDRVVTFGNESPGW